LGTFKQTTELFHRISLKTTDGVALAYFVLANNRRHSNWITLNGKGETVLTPQDLDWMPAKWWKLVTGESDSKLEPSRVNRRQFEVCVFRQLVQELKSADICVPGSDNYSDSREQLLSTDECNKALAEYGELVGLPVESQAFVDHHALNSLMPPMQLTVTT
jgi:hypothetical protein